MTQEEKQLLLADLCGRLPYGVKFRFIGNTYDMIGIRKFVNDDMDWVCGVVSDTIGEPIEIELIKPYLRPMSSMTEEEQKEFAKFHCVNICPIVIIEDLTISNESEMFDWLNKKMFDYRGLIPKGLAISTEEFNPYKD